MKFTKFAKSLAPDGGAICECIGQKWLVSDSVAMCIPARVRCVTGLMSGEMPDELVDFIFRDEYDTLEIAVLSKAVMPDPYGKIKDCIRVYVNQSGTLTLPISNDDWSLIEDCDSCDIAVYADPDDPCVTHRALFVYNAISGKIEGIISPCEYKE